MSTKLLTTKEEILTNLKTHGPMSVSNISKKVGITEMAVRRHLSSLERDDLLKITVERQPMGRPSNLYSLTENAEEYFPKLYINMLKDVLKLISEEKGSEGIKDIFTKTMNKKKEELYSEMYKLTNLKDKVNFILEKQTSTDFMIEITECENSYEIKQFNCPIIEIAKEYSEACKSEKIIYEDIFETEVEILHTIAEGNRYCEFSIKK